jgi:hypothetical protein
MGPFANTRKGALSFLVHNSHVAVGNEENEGSVLDQQTITSDELSRAAYLERENARLQKLVAELLVKNEQLRQQYLASSTVAD